MAATITLDEYIRDLKKMGGKDHRLTFINAQPYAVYLHARHGYYVFASGETVVRRLYEEGREAIRADVPMTASNRRKVMRSMAHKYLNFLRSTTSELRPPVRAGEGPRFAHPGHWADRKSHLVRSYWFEIDGVATGKARATSTPGAVES